MLKLPKFLVCVLMYNTTVILCYPLRPGELLLQSSLNDIKRIKNIFAPRFSQALATSNDSHFKILPWNQEMINARVIFEENDNIFKPKCAELTESECIEYKKLLDKIFKYDNTEIPTATNSYIRNSTVESEPGALKDNFESLGEDIETTTTMNDYDSTTVEEGINDRLAPAHVVASLLG